MDFICRLILHFPSLFYDLLPWFNRLPCQGSLVMILKGSSVVLFLNWVKFPAGPSTSRQQPFPIQAPVSVFCKRKNKQRGTSQYVGHIALCLPHLPSQPLLGHLFFTARTPLGLNNPEQKSQPHLDTHGQPFSKNARTAIYWIRT